MGACLCKTKRRSSSSGTNHNYASHHHRHNHIRTDSSLFSSDVHCPGSSGSSTSSASSSIQQRVRAHGILEALSLSGSNSDLSHFIGQNYGKNTSELAHHLQHINQTSANFHYITSDNNNNDQPNTRIWSLQNKLTLHADRLVSDTLESIRPAVSTEPSNTMQKLHLISETEIGWLVVISSLINKVDLEHPFGSALILLILEDAPLPTKKSISHLDRVLGLEMMQHERSVAKQRNISIVLGCLAEKLAGTLSSTLFSPQVQDYLLARIEPNMPVGACKSLSPNSYQVQRDHQRKATSRTIAPNSSCPQNDPNVILYSLIALEKFSQTIDNKLIIMEKLNRLGANNPLLKLERFKSSKNFIEQQVGFCATWDLDNHFLYESRPYSYETVDRDNINCMLNSKDASENLKISADGLVARNDTSRFESVRCTWPITSGVYYYEVKLVTPGVMQIGFATKYSKFLNHDGFGIGDDDQSFAYDGCRQLLWQNAKSTHTNLPRWKEGDVVGCLIDLEKFEIIFSLNGKMSEPNSDLFKNKPLSTQYYAAASFMPFQQCEFNFGRVPFVHPPETHNFRTFNQCATLKEDERIIIPRHLLLKKIHSTSLFPNACNICCDNPAVVTLEPCEHNGFCEICADLLESCPMCRTSIVSRKLGNK